MITPEEQNKIHEFFKIAYGQMYELFKINVESPDDKIWQTLFSEEGSLNSFVNAYVNYYRGMLEGIFLNLYMEEFSIYPPVRHWKYLQDLESGEIWDNFYNDCKEFARKDFEENG